MIYIPVGNVQAIFSRGRPNVGSREEPITTPSGPPPVENEKFLLKLKESLLIMRDKSSLNRNIRSASLYLFDKV